LSHSTSPFLYWVFSRYRVANYLPRLASNHDPPDLCLPSSQDYKHEPLMPGICRFLCVLILNNEECWEENKSKQVREHTFHRSQGKSV
jgi:hypothetical protein